MRGTVRFEPGRGLGDEGRRSVERRQMAIGPQALRQRAREVPGRAPDLDGPQPGPDLERPRRHRREPRRVGRQDLVVVYLDETGLPLFVPVGLVSRVSVGWFIRRFVAWFVSGGHVRSFSGLLAGGLQPRTGPSGRRAPR